MPIHPGMVEPLAERTRDLYADAESRLLGIIARQLAADLEAPGWAEQKLAAVQKLRRASQGVVDELGKAVELEVFDAVAESYNRGHRAAVAELGALSDDARALVDDITPNAQAVDRLAQEAVDRVTSTHRSILRTTEDGYRAVVAEVTADPLLGTATRRQATQDAMRRFADRGVSSFRDQSGRRWQMTSYAEMAVRTSVGRAATEAHMRTLDTAGVELVIVSSSPRECPLCRPWEREVLTIGGSDGARTVEVEHATDDGRTVAVRVAGSLDEARRAGLQHPNCRHSVSAYTPGITETEDAESDPDGYEAGQRQREIERNIRKYKRRAAAATTPEAKRAAEAKTRQWQGAMRDHLAAHPDLRRLRHREQDGAGNLPTPRTEAGGQHREAARIRSGDEQTPREMSDQQLADALHSGTLDDRARARIEGEADRRDREDLLARVRPEGRLAEDLLEFSDDDLLADRNALAATLDPAPDPDGWGAWADAPDDVWNAAAKATGATSRTADRDEEEHDEGPRITRRQAREMYDEYVYTQWLKAEEDTRGYLLNKKAETAGVDPASLFSGPARIAYARASDELKQWWAEHGRMTQAEFIEKATGVRSTAAERARQNEAEQQQRR